ncbi:MAG: DUF718 domain-containing protein [Rhizobiales bacterium]|nr:DUF718 domain-containing protein [Hyphomicrobiales bacterium]
MTAYNVVRFKVLAGKDRMFLEAHGPGKINWPGLRQGSIIQIGEGDYCLIGEWTDAGALSRAMPDMLATLDTFRAALQPTASGVTQAFSGPVVLSLA